MLGTAYLNNFLINFGTIIYIILESINQQSGFIYNSIDRLFLRATDDSVAVIAGFSSRSSRKLKIKILCDIETQIGIKCQTKWSFLP